MFYDIFYDNEDKKRKDYNDVLLKQYGIDNEYSRYSRSNIFGIVKENRNNKALRIEEDLIEYVIKHKDIEDNLKQ